MEEFVATWDTGATNSVITQRVIDACGLKPIGTTAVSHAQGTTDDVEVFLVNIGLPNGVAFPALRVTRGELRGTDVLIGMDIIAQGDFAVTNRDGNTKFSFRIPSIADIDFVAESQGSNTRGRQPRASSSSRPLNRQERRRRS